MQSQTDTQTGAVVPLPQQTAAVATVDMGGAHMPLVQAIELATRMAGGVTLPKHWREEGDIVAAVLTAMQWRVPLMTVIRGCHMIEGKVSPSADLMVAIALASGEVVDWQEEDLENPVGVRVTVIVRGRSRPVESTWTMDDAQRAGLAGKDNWRKYPRDMCRARAVSRAAARACPAAMAGVYSGQELQGEPPVAWVEEAHDPRPVEADVVESQARPAADSDPDVVAALVAAYDAATTRAEIDEADAAATAAKDDGTVPRGSRGIRTVAKARREALAALEEAEADASLDAALAADATPAEFDPANAVDTLEAE